ncbi:MAG: hypothetical protein K2W95_20025 [Candidatus Obscuribacterales bacterium]|nr:hypothetical protein [Candidatus Obscuribacterales bacterium]
MTEKNEDASQSTDRVDWTSGMGSETAKSGKPNSEACTREFDLPATEAEAKFLLMKQDRNKPRTDLAPAKSLMYDNESELKALLRSRKEDGKHTTEMDPAESQSLS